MPAQPGGGTFLPHCSKDVTPGAVGAPAKVNGWGPYFANDRSGSRAHQPPGPSLPPQPRDGRSRCRREGGDTGCCGVLRGVLVEQLPGILSGKGEGALLRPEGVMIRNMGGGGGLACGHQGVAGWPRVNTSSATLSKLTRARAPDVVGRGPVRLTPHSDQGAGPRCL